MPDPSTYRPAVGTIPEDPGVYKFRDPAGRVIYVGKAKSLRQRLNSYFADVWGLHPRTRQMVTTAASVEWTVVGTEVEALQLEYNWIKEFDPRFNVRYRDDKCYPSLAVTLNEEFPRLQVMRGPKRKGVRYFGPYAHAWAIRETLDLLPRVFPARTCSAGVFKRAGQIGRPCLLGYIGKCSAPCVGRVSAEEHREIVDDFCDFMAGRTEQMIRRLEREMAEAAEELEFERAARLRDDLGALRRALEKQAVVLGDGTDADVVAFAEDELEAAVQVFHVRGGRVRGQRGWIVDKVEDVTTGQLVEQFLLQVYGGVDEQTGAGEVGEAVPREVLVPELPDDAEVLRRAAVGAARLPGVAAGAAARRQAQPDGDRRAQRRGVLRPAPAQAGQRPDRPVEALAEIAEALGLADAPLRIECIDISHVQGTDVVASMVVFEDGLAKKSDYRRFSVAQGTDDVAAIAEVVRRRFARHLKEEADRRDEQGVAAEEGRPRRFAYPPHLLVVDGGAPQVAAAGRCWPSWASSTSPSAAWPSGWRRCGCPTTPTRSSCRAPREALYLLQRVRDEAHRFAITYHRQKRSKHDDGLAPGRRPGARRDPAQGAAAAVRLAQEAARGQRGGARRRCPASAGARPRRSSPRSPNRWPPAPTPTASPRTRWSWRRPRWARPHRRRRCAGRPPVTARDRPGPPGRGERGVSVDERADDALTGRRPAVRRPTVRRRRLDRAGAAGRRGGHRAVRGGQTAPAGRWRTSASSSSTTCRRR